ncbi:HNH endonuclease signature motif containing protein [Arthrobacter sp. Rue61a]|uniref:HNH endonuclease signature motif containing protein n=1 Tax=Arthrobacter sp. Rue61a TaxID=1118963 RepID=UPI000686F07E|nr:HNH endonuclease signature motif containing protein [Arthrobacter sp. Rue61a]
MFPRGVPAKSLGVPGRIAAFKSTTAAGTLADRPRAGELLRGPESLTWSSGFSSTANVNPVAMDHGMRMTQADDALSSLRESIADEALLFGFVEAADFAGRVEEISRSVEYLQLVAAQAVERTRKEAQQARPGVSAAAPEWRTGWTEPAGASAVAGDAASPGAGPAGAFPAGAFLAGASHSAAHVSAALAGAAHAEATAPAGSFLDDGYRNAAEFLRARLRIGIGEARRRLALAAEVLPQAGITGQDVPARREILADAIGSALVPSRSATIISTALDKVRHLAEPGTITDMEHALTNTAIESDPDFVTKMAKRWTDLIDQDGPEPTEEALRQLQGAFLRRRRRHGLHHLEIFATAEQYETLTTAMNAATNPRLNGPESGTAPSEGPDQGPGTGYPAGSGADEATMQEADLGSSGPDLDRRSRAQKLLDGLVGACSVAMSTAKLPSNGGLRPQVTVTIDRRDLFNQLQLSHTQPGSGNRLSTGTATFTGPIHPNTIRKIACDADILPVLLGSDSQILDIGRTTRIFPPHLRKAITARDQGCAFPDCTMPAPWCEAHHTTYWSHGGTTSTNNGTLLCSHHHHLIHKEQWRIDMTTGIPWFIPPPHIDPHQKPRRNHHHTPHKT